MKSAIQNLKRFSVLSFILLSISLSSQSIEMPPITDIDGQDFDYYYNPLNYNSKSNLTVNYHKKYEEGVYVDNSGKKTKGFIKLDENNIYFKKNLNEFQKSIKTKNIKYVKIGIDSFFTASNFYYDNWLRKSPEFLQFIGKVNDFYFAKHYKISKQSVVEQILAKKKTIL